MRAPSCWLYRDPVPLGLYWSSVQRAPNEIEYLIVHFIAMCVGMPMTVGLDAGRICISMPELRLGYVVRTYLDSH